MEEHLTVNRRWLTLDNHQQTAKIDIQHFKANSVWPNNRRLTEYYKQLTYTCRQPTVNIQQYIANSKQPIKDIQMDNTRKPTVYSQ